MIQESFSSSTSGMTAVRGGTWTVTNGRYALTRPATAKSGNGNIALHARSLPGDFTLSAAASAQSTASTWDDFSVLFGYRDAGNYYYVSFNETNDPNTSGIFRVAGGVATQIADIASPTAPGTMHQVRVERQGTALRVYRNRSLVAATQSATTSGRVGFGTLNNAATFDDLTVTHPVTTGETSAASAPLFSESFSGSDGVFSDQKAFWGTSDLGLSQNATMFTDSGAVYRRASQGWSNSSVMRTWTRKADFAFATASADIRFNGWAGGSAGWHGINLWMNERLCMPAPGCEKVKDGTQTGSSGYALDFMNRDGSLTILKKVGGDTRAKWPGAVSYSNYGTYYQLARTTWKPVPGRSYRFTGRVIDTAAGAAKLQVLIDGQVKLEVVDNGTKGGPRLTGGRVGLRSDYADYTVDNFTITR